MNRASALLLCATLVATAAPHGADIQDLSGQLAPHNPKWTSLPTRWENGVALGNGVAGVVWHATPEDNRLDFRFARRSADDAAALELGRLILRPTGWLLEGEARTDLWNAEANARVETNLGLLRLRWLTLRDRSVHVLELSSIERFADGRPVGWEWEYRPDDATHSGRVTTTEGVSLYTRTLSPGVRGTTAWTERVDADGRSSRVFVATSIAATETEANRLAIDAVRAAADAAFNDLLRAHRAWWQQHYRHAAINVPAPRTDAHYWQQIHHLAAQPQPVWPLAPSDQEN